MRRGSIDSNVSWFGTRRKDNERKWVQPTTHPPRPHQLKQQDTSTSHRKAIIDNKTHVTKVIYSMISFTSYQHHIFTKQNGISQSHHFFSPPSAFCTLPPIAPSGLKFLPIAPSLESGPPTFSPTLPMAPSLVKAPPMVPFASKAAGAFWSEGFWPLGRVSV